MPSPKINSKSLSYSSDLPPFLRALHAQAGGGSSSHGGGPDPILAGRRRAAKKRSQSEEAEDQPLIVDEHGNTVQLDEADASQHGESSKPSDGQEGAAGASQTESEDKAKATPSYIGVGGAGRKRRLGKVVGAEESQDAAVDTKEGNPADRQKSQSKASKNGGIPKKKVAKKIKLSFDDEEA